MREGFSLVEVVLALGIVSFALVAILGLFSVGLRGTQESEQTIDAANLGAAMLGRRLASPTTDLPALAGQNFGLPKIPSLELLPTVPSWTHASVLVGSGGYEAAGTDSAYRLTYDYWRDTNSTFSTNSRLVKVHVILSSPPDAPLARASSRYEVTASAFLP
jgi:type II secretory pathway pseudopilin PulG